MYNDFWELMEDCNHNFEITNEEYIRIISDLKDNTTSNVGDYNLKLISDKGKLLVLALNDLESEENEN